MRAVVYSELGASSVLQLVDRDLPTPHWGEVRVRLAVAGVNPTDWKFRAGTTAGSLPFDEVVPGQDGAGIVDEVGNGVTGVSVGDRVWVFLAQHERPLGTAAEYTVVPADRVVRLPCSAFTKAAFGDKDLRTLYITTAHVALNSEERRQQPLAGGLFRVRIDVPGLPQKIVTHGI